MKTSHDMKEKPTDEPDKCPRQSIYSQGDTEKDPYPWLDEKDPRRLITDREILEVQQTCLKPVSQKAKVSSV